ncbi:carboxymuconolactone decarboxylase family protein [Salipiger sp. PrR002]|uniref:carboxymuconolactone decarboxylase family protein n=1 Tax=Salipiger sp. PrR002 TaxID=2706489 RepID=UPI0013B8E3D9|nr:carboxymuconolactone decarboxylase family protein [Salipiger sp. PrR002]NDW01024.1 carboxymuconolactone decarboxylase family protein [Salipiger sp. PrR002]NDW58573.1 carboxymuconolactone decarboxylase family protein [Salipiger sp. PrR004]
MTDFTIHTLESAPEASRPLLEDSNRSFGRVPGLHAVMAEAPALLDGYKHLHRLFGEATSFDKDEITVVWQTINVEHECHYCVPAHTGIAKMMKVDDAITEALRDETPLPNARLEALRNFTLQMVRQRGDLSAAQVEAFLQAGFTRQQILEVILGVAQKVMSNYTNHLAETPVDAVMQKFAWEKKAEAEA